MKKVLLPIMVIILLSIVAGSYAATTDTAKKFNIKLGVFMPSNGDVKDTLGSTWFAIQGAYSLTKTATEESFVELGWTGNKKDDVKGHIVPLTYTYEIKSPSKFYYGGGAGIYFAKVEDDFDSESKTQFGLHALAGYDITDTIGAELRYTWMTSKFEDVRLDGLSLYLTGKF